MSEPTTRTEGYAGGRKKRTSVSIDQELSAIAKRFFPGTGHGSMSAFFEAKLEQEFRKKLPLIKAMGMKVPKRLIEKESK